jgi:hypothetical protein
VGGGCAALWVLLCLRWFDAGAALRPAVVGWLHPSLLAAGVILGAVYWLREYRASLWPLAARETWGMALVTVSAIAFRLPMVAHAAAGYTTADASMAGLMALRIHEGAAHDVFIPNLAYCGSLKSHLAAPLMGVMDPARALALVSVLFYALFVVGIYRLAQLAAGERAAAVAGLYAAFSPTFITQYSLTNDGNYVELLAFGTWAALLTAQWLRPTERHDRPRLALCAGVLLGAGFWCHVLGIIYIVAVVSAFLAAGVAPALRSAPALTAGFALGNLPAILWNRAHAWSTFRYLLPSEYRGAAQSPLAAQAHGPVGTQGGFADRAWALFTDHGPLLFGFDPGYGGLVDGIASALAYMGLATTLLAGVFALHAAFKARSPSPEAVVAWFGIVNIGVVTAALPHLDGNPRYLLFTFTASALLVPLFLRRHRLAQIALGVLIAFGALGSMGQASTKRVQDVQWRTFLIELEDLGIRSCHSDYYVASRITFFSGKGISCSSRIGPTWTDYFEIRAVVDRSPNPALIAPNAARADKIERKLEKLGIAARRVDLFYPTLLPERTVDPRALFSQQPD